jgi:hypothetical protein
VTEELNFATQKGEKNLTALNAARTLFLETHFIEAEGQLFERVCFD